MSRRMLALIAVLALALAILTGLAVRTGVLGPPEQTAAIGGPFQLVDQTGRTVDEDVLKGKWSAVFFGFTHCPDVCPTTLFALGQVEPLLGERAERFQTVFVSVDPARDTPQQVAAYVANPAFPKRIVGLTGSEAQVEQAVKAYRAYRNIRPEDGDYAVDHSSYVFLMSPVGRFVCVLPYGLSPEQTAGKIQSAMQAGPNAETC